MEKDPPKNELSEVRAKMEAPSSLEVDSRDSRANKGLHCKRQNDKSFFF